MADDSSGDKTEPATARRREESRNNGHIAKSQDLTQAALLMAGLLALSMTAHTIMDSFEKMMLSLLGSGYWASSQELMDNSLRISTMHLVRILAPIMISVAVVSFLVT